MAASRAVVSATGRAAAGKDAVADALRVGERADGSRQLRHSPAKHLDEASTSADVIMAKTGHKSLNSVARQVYPSLAAVLRATQALSSLRRRG